MFDRKTQQKLNDYLREIEIALGEISVAERSDILLELDGHIRESLEKGGQSIDQILEALGSPQQVANRYLLSKGIQPVKPRGFPWFKAIGLTTLGVMSLTVIALVLLIRSFSPILHVDEEAGRVVILGGLIDVNEKEGKVSLGKGKLQLNGQEVNFKVDFEGNTQEFDGVLNSQGKSKLNVSGTNGKFKFETSESKDIEYSCEVANIGDTINLDNIIVTDRKGEIDFQFSDNLFSGAKCDLIVPKGLDLKVELGNGKLVFDELQQNASLKLDNGMVEFFRHPEVAYSFKTRLKRGAIAGLGKEDYNNKDPKAYKIDIEATNGKIEVQ